MCKVSVIVPIYGVEKYIERCVKSLFNQTLDDIEYIFVDDCTQDNSIEILNRVLDHYPHRKSQTTILHHDVNKGLPITRQTGLRVAKGKYVAYCDSDDWVDVDMYRRMYEEAERSSADIVVCDFYKASMEGYELRRGFKKGTSAKDAYKYMLFQQIPWCVWNKLFKRSLYQSNSIFYPKETHGEDMALCLQLFYYAHIVSYVDVPFYYYLTDSDTAIHVFNGENIYKKFRAAVENAKLVESFLKSKWGGTKYMESGLIYIKMAQRDKLVPLIEKKYYFDIWNTTFPEINNKILFDKEIRLRHKVRYLLLRLHMAKFLVRFNLITY